MIRRRWRLTSAVDGDEALCLARQRLPDLILLARLLPKRSGPDVLKTLELDPATKAVPVVVRTGMSQKNAARLQHDGALGFLEKSTLELDKGPAKLLLALEEIIEKLASAQARTQPHKLPRTLSNPGDQ